MRVRGLLLGVMMVSMSLAGCVFDASADRAPNPVVPCGELDRTFQVDPAYSPRVRMETSNGTVTAAIFLEQVPFTAGNFLELVRDDFFDGTRFHQLHPGGFVQGGDPNTRDAPRERWGTGGPGYSIPDEFHQYLRHDEPGVLSMAQSKPNSGGSQFLISLRPLPSLDDHNSVFGEVVDGLQNVRELAKTPTDDRNRPEFQAKLEEAEILPPKKDPESADAKLTSYGYDCEQAAEPGGTAEFMVAARNTGQRLVNGTFGSDGAEMDGNWSVEIRNTNVVGIPSGHTKVYVVDVDVPEDAEPSTSHTLNVTFADKASSASTTRSLTVNVGPLGEEPERGSKVVLRYVGVLEDGRPFDTTIETFVDDGSLTWFKPPPEHLEALQVELGNSGLIDGMSELANRAKIGQSVVGSVAPSDGYGTDQWGRLDLGGRLLYFQMDVLEPGEIPSTDTTRAAKG